MKKEWITPAGLFTSRITVQRATDGAPTASGMSRPTFTGVTFKRWAQIIPNGAREFTQALQTVEAVTSVVRVHYDRSTSKITAKDRIVTNGSTLNISGVLNEGNNNRTILLYCVEGT